MDAHSTSSGDPYEQLHRAPIFQRHLRNRGFLRTNYNRDKRRNNGRYNIRGDDDGRDNNRRDNHWRHNNWRYNNRWHYGRRSDYRDYRPLRVN
jgi:hypothetical protein